MTFIYWFVEQQAINIFITVNTKALKWSYCAFLVFAFPLLCYEAFLCIFRVCKWKMPKVHSKGSYSLPQKTLLLHCLFWSQAFTSVTYVHHYVTGITWYIFIVKYIHSNLSADIIFDHTTMLCFRLAKFCFVMRMCNSHQKFDRGRCLTL